MVRRNSNNMNGSGEHDPVHLCRHTDSRFTHRCFCARTIDHVQLADLMDVPEDQVTLW